MAGQRPKIGGNWMLTNPLFAALILLPALTIIYPVSPYYTTLGWFKMGKVCFVTWKYTLLGLKGTHTACDRKSHCK